MRNLFIARHLLFMLCYTPNKMFSCKCILNAFKGTENKTSVRFANILLWC